MDKFYNTEKYILHKVDIYTSSLDFVSMYIWPRQKAFRGMLFSFVAQACLLILIHQKERLTSLLFIVNMLLLVVKLTRISFLFFL